MKMKMNETMIQKAEREADEAQTKLVHTRAVLAKYPNATRGRDGRIYAARVDVVGMDWDPGIGPSGGFVFYEEIPTERGHARVYDYLTIPIDEIGTYMGGRAAFISLAMEFHAAALARQIRHEEEAVARERDVLGKVTAYLTTSGEVTTDQSKADPNYPPCLVERPLPEQRHVVTIDPNATRG